MSLIKHDDVSQKQLAKHLDMSREALSYHVHKLLENDLIYDKTKGSNKWKFYGVTVSGEKILAEYESNKKKELKGIENARWKSQIRNTENLQKFLSKNNFKRNDGVKNWTQWNGKIQGFSISINIGRLTNIVITHPPYYDKDLQSAYHKVNDHILDAASNLNKKWKFNLTLPELITTRQYTMSNSISEYLLDKSSRTQLKLKNGKISIDASKGGEPRIEFEVFDEAQKFADIPEFLLRLQKQIEIQNKNTEQHDAIFTKAFETVLKQNQTTNNILTGILNTQNQDKIEQKNLNIDSTRMIG